MDATKEPGEARGAETAAPEAARDRAKAYLDLWERQLAHAALHGRQPAGAEPRPFGIGRAPRAG